MEMPKQFITPDWDVPVNIKSLVTTRQGGYSQSPYDSFNLGIHVDDDPLSVKKNRKILADQCPSEPVWLNQVHSNIVLDAAEIKNLTDADGSYTLQKNIVSVVLTADCLPVLVCTRQGDAVAALHAGWRGLLNGVLEQGISKLLKASRHAAKDCLIWFGPAISSENFEVGREVRDAFLQKSADKKSIEQCFSKIPAKQDKFMADMVQLAQYRLSQIGVENFSTGHYCSYRDKEQFFSYRRDGITGRMASLIWIEDK